MAYTIAQVAAAIGGIAEGDQNLKIEGLAEPASAGPSQLALAASHDYEEALKSSKAQTALLAPGADWRALGLRAAVFTDRAKYTMSSLTAIYDHHWRNMPSEIHPTAVIHPSAKIGPDAAIGPFCVIGAGVSIGSGLRMAAHVSVGLGTVIGKDATLREGVRILHEVRIGDRFIAQPNAVIGGDGFSFATATPSKAETMLDTHNKDIQPTANPWARVHSLGGVLIGDDVEIGAQTCVDRGTIRATEIGTGTKIDNFVQIAHNVQVGAHCLMCGSSGVAGSTIIGNGVIVAGAGKISDNLKIGEGAVIAAAAIVTASVPAGRVVMGYPAIAMDAYMENYRASRRLPRILREVGKLKKSVSQLPKTL